MLQKVMMHFDPHHYKPPDKSIGSVFFGGLSDYIQRALVIFTVMISFKNKILGFALSLQQDF